MIDDIREQARSDSEILHNYSLVNGGTKKECKTCINAATLAAAALAVLEEDNA